MFEIKLPRMDDDHEESSIVFWYKQEGDEVSEGDTLVEVQTEKSVSEIEAETDGILEKILVPRGGVAKVGDVLCIINPEPDQASKDTEKSGATVSTDIKDGKEKEFVRIAPRLRKIAKDLGVDLTAVIGTGPGGKITEEDIRNTAAEGVSSEERPGRPLQGIRKTIAARMMGSLHNSAQLTETAYADVTSLSERRSQHEVKLSWNTWILSAVIQALKEHPYINGTLENGKLKQSEKIHLGIAVDTDHGLMVPVVNNAEQLSLTELEEEVNTKAEQARSLKLSKDELSGSTFTVTNLGAYGIHFFTPIINPPEIAILGVGHIEEYLKKEDGEIVERKRLPLSLTFDHQAVDGAPAARFLKTLTSILEN